MANLARDIRLPADRRAVDAIEISEIQPQTNAITLLTAHWAKKNMWHKIRIEGNGYFEAATNPRSHKLISQGVEIAHHLLPTRIKGTFCELYTYPEGILGCGRVRTNAGSIYVSLNLSDAPYGQGLAGLALDLRLVALARIFEKDGKVFVVDPSQFSKDPKFGLFYRRHGFWEKNPSTELVALVERSRHRILKKNELAKIGKHNSDSLFRQLDN